MFLVVLSRGKVRFIYGDSIETSLSKHKLYDKVKNYSIMNLLFYFIVKNVWHILKSNIDIDYLYFYL